MEDIKHTSHNKIIKHLKTIKKDLISDGFNHDECIKIIVIFTIMRRVDLLLESTKTDLINTKEIFDVRGVTNQHTLLQGVTGYPFYNNSNFTFNELLLSDSCELINDFNCYINGFSDNILEIINIIGIHERITSNKDLLSALLVKFTTTNVNLSPVQVLCEIGNITHEPLDKMGLSYIFEELNKKDIKKFAEHYTPTEITKILSDVLFVDGINGDITLYDPACGTGNLLNGISDIMIDNPDTTITLCGQELNLLTYAICKADMLLNSDTPELNQVKQGSTISNDGFIDSTFDYMVANPPYGMSWANERDNLTGDIFKSRVPRTSDGQLLFLLTMIAKMGKSSRIASVHSASPLFNGDADSGESNIRQLLIEHDYLECIIKLPKGMFYNTPITTYIWVISNDKCDALKGKVQLIDASKLFNVMDIRMGYKINQITPDQVLQIVHSFKNRINDNLCKIYKNSHFGYTKLTMNAPFNKIVERVPLDVGINHHMDTEVHPYEPCATINHSKTKIGYIIHFDRYFYKSTKYRTIATIQDDISNYGNTAPLNKEMWLSRVRYVLNHGLNDTELKLTDIGYLPNNWKVSKLKYLVDLSTGKTPGKFANGEMYTLIGSGGVMGYNNDYMADGDNVIIGYKGTIGNPQFVRGKFWTVNTTYYTTKFHNMLPKFFYYCCLLIDFTYYSTCAILPGLTQKDIKDIKMPCPPLYEQQAIIDYLEL